MKKTILVVDDDRSIRRAFAQILQRGGYDIETAENGREALGKTKNRHFDLVLIDRRLPDMDGTDLLVKAKEQLQKTAKIMVTGFPSVLNAAKALEEGVDAYLIKPVRPQDLLKIIDDRLCFSETIF